MSKTEKPAKDKFQRYTDSQKAKGLTLIRVWVPETEEEKVKKHCERLRKKHAKLKDE